MVVVVVLVTLLMVLWRIHFKLLTSEELSLLVRIVVYISTVNVVVSLLIHELLLESILL